MFVPLVFLWMERAAVRRLQVCVLGVRSSSREDRCPVRTGVDRTAPGGCSQLSIPAWGRGGRGRRSVDNFKRNVAGMYIL